MKTEFLQNLKIGDQALTKEIIDAILAENGRDIEAAKKPFTDYDTLKTQLTEANKVIEGFKALDVDGVKKAAEEWKAKAERAEADAAAKIADMEFQNLLSSAITSAKGKNVKAVAALLDLDAIKASKNQEADLKSALKALEEEHEYLFETEQTPPPYASGTGTHSVTGKYTPEEIAIRAAAGLKVE